MTLVFLILLLCSALRVDAATSYVDKNLTTDCVRGNYSLVNRNCSGSDGKAYRTPSAALATSVADDTILLRTGTYTLLGPIQPKSGQVWSRYQTEKVILDGKNGTARRIFHINNAANVTIDGLTLTGAYYEAVWATIGVPGGTCANTIVRNVTIENWNWGNANYYGAVKFSQCLQGRIENNTIRNPKYGVAAGQLSVGGIDLAGDCSTKAGGGTVIFHNAVSGDQIAQGIRLDVCAGHPLTPGGRHRIEQNLVENTRLGLHVEAGSSGVFVANTVRNSQVLGFESRARGAESDANIGVELIGNMFDRAGWNLVRFTESNTGALSNKVVFTGNILHNDNVYPALLVHKNTAASPTNSWVNNTITNTGSGNRAICWGVPSTNLTLSCPTGIPLYAQTQLTAFNADTGNTGNAGSIVPTDTSPCP